MDANWWIPEPFLGERDLFYVEKKDKENILNNNGALRVAFVRHSFWMHKVFKLNTVLWSNLSAMSYKRAFKG